MRKIGILILFFLAASFGLLGQSKLDSLENQLSSAQSDSVRLLLLIELSEQAEFYDYARARTYSDRATEVSDRINADWARGKLLFRLASLETLEGDYDDALRFDLECVKLYGLGRDSTSLARAQNDVGSDYRDLGEYQEAYFYLTQSYRTAKSHKSHNHEDSLVMAIALHNMGSVFTQLSQFDIALSHLKASERVSTRIHDLQGPAYTFDELGELYKKKKDFNQSETYLLAALREARRQKIRVLVPMTQLHLASLFLEKKEFSKSLIYYDSVIEQQTGTNNRFGLAECALGKGRLMLHSGNFDEAEKLYRASLNSAKELNAQNLELSCYKELASLYESTRNYQQALYYVKEHNALRDSIFSEAEMEKLFQNQVRFETENKDIEIAALSQARLEQSSEMRRQELVRNVLVIVVALSAFLLFTVYRSSSRRKKINKLLLEHQEEIKKRSLELEQLNQVKDKFFSIISHDLRSPMNALAGTLDLLEQKNISPSEFAELSQNLRIQFDHTRTLINNLLNWTLVQMDKLKIQPEKVVVHKKVEESFAALGNLYPKNISMENRVNEKIIASADPNIINLVLRNLILNAIKFTENGGRIWVEAVEKTNEIIVSVSDNGIGIKAEVKEMLFKKTAGYSTRGTANEKGTGLGLILCKEFVEKNGGWIWLESELGKGTTFFFTLPKSQ